MGSVPQGSVLGQILSSIMTRHGIKCTLSKIMEDTKLRGADDMLNRRDAIQREVEGLQRWAHVNLLELNKILCLDHGNHQ